jgi:hypothetical protein
MATTTLTPFICNIFADKPFGISSLQTAWVAKTMITNNLRAKYGIYILDSRARIRFCAKLVIPKELDGKLTISPFFGDHENSS